MRAETKLKIQKISGDYFIGRRIRSYWLGRELRAMPHDSVRLILDAGCGDGMQAILTAQKYPHAKVIGIDADDHCIKLGRQRKQLWGVENIYFLQANLLGLSETFSEKFNLIYCNDVLEHIREDEALLKIFYYLLLPGGTLILHVPQKEQFHFLKSPYRNSHLHHCIRSGYTREEIHQKIELAGFAIQSHTLTTRWSGTLACDISQFFVSNPKLWLIPLRLIAHPITLLLAGLDPLCSGRQGNGIIIRAIKESK